MKWFRRLAEVPGISYQSPSSMERSALKGHDWSPTLYTFEFDGREQSRYGGPSLERYRTSASPVHQRTHGSGEERTSKEELRWLEQTLEVPGEPSDYHFAIMKSYKRLFDMRALTPEVLHEVERLCWLDLELVEAQPQIVEYEPGKHIRVPAYYYLIRLYEGEGYLAEALEVAERGLNYSHQDDLEPVVERLRAELDEFEVEESLD